MLMESGMGCCCPKEDALFWKNLHIDAMKQLVKIRQENLELRKQLDCEMTKHGILHGRIIGLDEEVQALRAQLKTDQMVKKDLDEKLDKAAADYKALWVENEDLKSQLAGTNLLKQLNQAQEELAGFIAMYDKAAAEAHQAKVAKDRMGYSNRCMQSKIAKQSNEIKRLTEENKALRRAYDTAGKALDASLSFSELKRLTEENEQLHKALELAAKDADANFERGKIKGMEEIWDELGTCYDGRPIGANQKIFGYATVGDILMNLSPTWFMNKAEEYRKQEEQLAKDIQIGDEVEVIDKDFNPDLSDIGIVIAVYPDRRSFEVIGPKFTGCFDKADIQKGSVKKTGRHFVSIPLDYLA